MSAAYDLERAIEQAGALIQAASRLISEGRVLDLKGLEGRIARLCRSVAARPGLEAQSYLPRLEALAAGLDELGQVVDDRRALLAEFADEMPPAGAAAAYGRGN
jgi:hypothetical protein